MGKTGNQDTPESTGGVSSPADPTSTFSKGSLEVAERPTGTDPGVADFGKKIGGYRIIRKIGEGGMGAVFEAEQRDPRRAVALKVIHGGPFIDETHVKMFQREAQALARLKHPAIAAIYESGRTDDGRHFFAMELVRGDTLKEWLRMRRSPKGLSGAELKLRLALFGRICDAVAYAHQRAVVHRDLKPTNILVLRDQSASSGSVPNRSPQIKILDFGLARITDMDVAVTTIVTEIGKVQGTLPYMSPEQIRGNPDEIDFRTDVYSLGVLLFEMLTGQRPYDIGRGGIPEAARVISEARPKSLSRTRDGRGKIDRELETIVQKALEKEPSHRYQSVAGLGGDVERHLRDQPILARPPGAVYRFRKLIRRNRVAVGIVAGILVALIGFAVRERIQSDRIFREAEAARQVSEFLTGLFEVSDPGEARGNTITARELLDTGARRIETELGDAPALQARLMGTMGTVYRNLGLFPRAEQLQEASLTTRRRLLGEAHPDTLASMHELARVYTDQGRYEEAEPLLRDTYQARLQVLGDEHLDTLRSMRSLAVLYRKQGRYEEAEPLFIKTLEAFERVLGDDHPDTLRSMHSLGTLYWRQQLYSEAEPLYRRTLDIRTRLFGDDHPDTLSAMINLANLYSDQGRKTDAEPLYARAVDTAARVLGEDHPHTLAYMYNLATLYLEQGHYDKAGPLYRDTLAIQKRVLPDDHPDISYSYYGLAATAALQGRRERALGFIRQSVEHGFDSADWLAQDPDLESLHGPEFDRILERARRNAAARSSE